MAEDAKLRAVVTEPPFDRLFAESQTDVVLVGASRESDAPAANPSVDVGPEHLAYVLYTSGSTGHPKGVEVTRGGFLNLIGSMRDLPGMTAEDSIVALTTVSFDIAGVETLLPLALGARIILATRPRQSEALRALIERTSPTIAGDAGHVQDAVRVRLARRRQGEAICGGNRFPVELGASLSAACGEAWNGYGPTETTVYSAFTTFAAATGSPSVVRPRAPRRRPRRAQCPVPQGDG
jgi:non-ribosomal peptide synthetase component F